MTVPHIFCAAPGSACRAADRTFGENALPAFGNCQTERVLIISATSAVTGVIVRYGHTFVNTLFPLPGVEFLYLPVREGRMGAVGSLFPEL